MKIETKALDKVMIVTVSGSVDALTAAELTAVLTKQTEGGYANLVVDLAGLDFMSSAGLRTLLGAVKECRNHGGDLRIVSAKPGIDKVLKMSGFHNIAKVFTSESDAVASFK